MASGGWLVVDAEKVSWGSLLFLIALFEFRTVITLSLPMLDYLARHSYQKVFMLVAYDRFNHG